jgi:hypothetical protein
MSDDDELPPVVEESIASWYRTIASALPENAADVLCNAAADLFGTRKVSKNIYPDSDGIVNQAIVDGLHDMAVIAEIDDNTAQLIFAKAQARVDKPAEHMNGRGARDQTTERILIALLSQLMWPPITVLSATSFAQSRHIRGRPDSAPDTDARNGGQCDRAPSVLSGRIRLSPNQSICCSRRRQREGPKGSFPRARSFHREGCR